MKMTFEMRKKIREAYRKHYDEIMAGRVNQYGIGIDWIDKMTPIEQNLFASIRFLGIPLFPQYPIGNYYVDFGDPVNRIAIEVDGRQWHKDREKDDRRDGEIRSKGWAIFHVDGWMTMKIRDDFYDCDDGEWFDEESQYSYFTETGEGFLIRLYSGVLKYCMYSSLLPEELCMHKAHIFRGQA